MKFIFLMLVLVGIQAHGDLPEGTYGSEQMHFYVRRLPGRQGSSVGVMILRHPFQVQAYLIDPLRDDRYALVPLVITKHFSMGVSDDNPTLVAVLTAVNNQTVLAIHSANSSNQTGFTGGFSLLLGRSESTWVDLVPGNYGYEEIFPAMVVRPLDPVNRASEVGISTRNLSGGFFFNERLPGLFVIHAQAVLATGEEMQREPRAFGFFLRQWESRRRKETISFFFVNDRQVNSILVFEKDHPPKVVDRELNPSAPAVKKKSFWSFGTQDEPTSPRTSPNSHRLEPLSGNER